MCIVPRTLKELAVTCASGPLVPSNVGSVVCVNLAVLRGTDVQAAVPLDGDLVREVLVRHTVSNTERVATGLVLLMSCL